MNSHPHLPIGPCSPSFAAERTRVLLGCYRQDQWPDPEVFVPAMAAVLAHFPADIVEIVTNPFHGLPSRSKWPPTIAEVRAACDEEMRPRLDRLARERRVYETGLLLAAALPTQEERDRMIARWENEIRPQLMGHKAKQSKEAAQAMLDRLEAAPKPQVKIGEGLAGKLAAQAKERAA